ncbi:MAG: glycosyl hydrolase, partial [Longimicrobiales bacterium]
STLRQLTPAIAAADVHLFDPVDPARGLDQGVAINYFLKAPAQRVVLDILDARGQVLRSFNNDTTGAGAARAAAGGDDDDEGGGRAGGPARTSNRVGVNRFVWDTRHTGPTTFPNMILWAAGSNGPRALPGDYSVRLRVDGRAPATQSFSLRPDPRSSATMADLQAQFELAIQVRDRTSAANEAVIRIRDVKAQIDDRVKKASSNMKLPDAAQQLKDKLSRVEEELYQVRNQSNQDPLNYPIKLNNKLAALLGAVEGVDGRPTAQSHEVMRELSARLDQQLNWLNTIFTVDVPRFNTEWLRGTEPIRVPGRPVS